MFPESTDEACILALLPEAEEEWPLIDISKLSKTGLWLGPQLSHRACI